MALSLPSEFLTEEDFSLLLHDHHDRAPITHSSVSAFRFPTQFTYEFDSETSCDEEDFLAELTRRLTLQLSARKYEKRVMAGSPESTLSGIGSWSVSSNSSPNGVLSPPTTPFGVKNETLDLIYAAAGEVARLKMNSELKNNTNKYSCFHGKGLLGADNALIPQNTDFAGVKLRNNGSNGVFTGHGFGQLGQQNLRPNEQTGMFGRQEQVKAGWQAILSSPQQRMDSRGGNIWSENGACTRPLGSRHAGWPPIQSQEIQSRMLQYNMQNHHIANSGRRPVVHGGPVKKVCAGTGVFLPRRYSNPDPNPYPPECKKKSACATYPVPAKVRAPNMNFAELSVNCHPQPRFKDSPFAPDYDAMMRTRNAIYAQPRSSSLPETGLNREIHLPQEWTY